MEASLGGAGRAVVIGSGFGGLAAAVRLGAKGHRVTVLERLDRPGGRARSFEQGGHVFDAGPTIVTAPWLFEELWALCGRDLADDVGLVALDPFYTIRFANGGTFRYSGDPEAMRAEVARLSPGDVEGYERFLKFSAKVCAVAFERLGHVPFLRLSDMAKVAPDLLRLGGLSSVHGLVKHFVKHPKLRTVLGYHPLLVGGNPFKASGVYALIAHLERRWGVHHAVGGTGSLVRGLVGLIEAQGGEVRCNAGVERIELAGGGGGKPPRGKPKVTGVRLTGGEVLPAEVVVSNADPATTYGRLLPENHRRRRWTNRKLNAARQSMGLFVWYFGTDRRFDDVGQHTILLGPRYEGLLKDVFERKVLADDFSLYLHRPTATDASLAPPGCDTFYVLSPVPNLAGGQDWAKEAEPYRRKIAAFLERNVLPGLGEAVTASEVATPLTFERDFLSPLGCGFSLEPILTQSAWFRPHNASEEADGLYLVGAGTHPGAGIPGVLSSAKALEGLVATAPVPKAGLACLQGQGDRLRSRGGRATPPSSVAAG